MSRFSVSALILTLSLAGAGSVSAGESQRDWWRDSFRDPHWESACEEKMESKPGESKREIKCPHGRGATWRGEWKEEFSDGPCRVKVEATREVYKEEVKCDRQ